MAVAIPLIAMAASGAGAVIQGAQQSNALAYNSAVYGQEAKVAAAQGYEQEATTRRHTAGVIGQQVAAAGQSGGGYQGSTGASIGQSAMNAELDALNVRYKSQLQKWAYGSQAQNLSDESSTAASSGTLRAGAALLKGYSSNYISPTNDLG